MLGYLSQQRVSDLTQARLFPVGFPGKKGSCPALPVGKSWANAALDIKKLGKIDGVGHCKVGLGNARRRRPGWEYLHACVDDASRVAYTAILPDETAESAVEFLWFAVAWYASHGNKVERMLMDYGS